MDRYTVKQASSNVNGTMARRQVFAVKFCQLSCTFEKFCNKMLGIKSTGGRDIPDSRGARVVAGCVTLQSTSLEETPNMYCVAQFSADRVTRRY